MTFSTPRLISLFDYHDSCHHNVNQCYASEVFLFGQVLEDDHGSADNGIPHVDETPENPLASHHMFYAIPKHFVILIRNRTKEGLNTISFHGLMPDTYQCFHQLCTESSTLIMFGCWTWIFFFSFWEQQLARHRGSMPAPDKAALTTLLSFHLQTILPFSSIR